MAEIRISKFNKHKTKYSIVRHLSDDFSQAISILLTDKEAMHLVDAIVSHLISKKSADFEDFVYEFFEEEEEE